MAQFEILDCVDTPLGQLILRRRELLGRAGTLVTEVTIDHELLMSSLHTESEEALSRRTLARLSGEGLRVLVGGLGLGYTAAAALADERVAQVEVVERLPDVIRWLNEGLLPLSETLRSDERLSVTEGDVYARLLEAPASALWDAILIDVDHSPSQPLAPSSAPFYTPAGLRQVSRHLRPAGQLAVWSVDDDAAFRAALAEVFAETEAEQVSWRNELIDTGHQIDDWLFLAKA